MKKRVTIIFTTLIIFSILGIINMISPNQPFTGILGSIALIFIVYALIYAFGGLAKVIVYAIYGVFSLLLIIILSDYQIAIAALGSILFVVHPLADLENELLKTFNESQILPLNIDLYGDRAAYMAYRKDMKSAYHRPQTIKLYTKVSYLKLRQLSVLLLSSFGIFLLIKAIGVMAIRFENFTLESFFSSIYGVLSILTIVLILIKKGFTSAFRAVSILIFPPIIYALYIYIPNGITKLVITAVLLLIFIVISIVEYIKLQYRVVFEYYNYYDQDKQLEVYANALFEPFVYNEHYQISVVYEIDCSLAYFNKKFNDILVYANRKKFFITAYTNDKKKIKLYTEFHNNDEKKVEAFLGVLKRLFTQKIKVKRVIDQNKSLYEHNFFHQTPYIVARALYLADVLKELEIKNKVIISFIAFFKNEDDLKRFSDKYTYTILNKIKYDDYIPVKVDIQVPNKDYIIETRVQDFLLELMIHRGTFVRINLYY